MPLSTPLSSKIQSEDQLKETLSAWRKANDKIVFTNGVFDILHRGHVEYLAKAAELGDRLIVGLNDDASVRRLNKGSERPINDQQSRAVVLAALGCVCAVVIFSEPTPLQLINLIQPDVLVKGGDYDAAETDPQSKQYIVGSDILRKQGKQVTVIPLTAGFSTTNLVNKLKNG